MSTTHTHGPSEHWDGRYVAGCPACQDWAVTPPAGRWAPRHDGVRRNVFGQEMTSADLKAARYLGIQP